MAVAVVANTAAVANAIATNRIGFSRAGFGSNRPRSSLFRAASSLVCRAQRLFSADFNKGRMSQVKEQHIEVEGVVTVVLPGTMFRVELQNKHMVLATICGKMRKRWVRITAGDRVKMEMSPYDLNKARITWRLR
jgi:translation initiation factor IF-1